MSTSDHTVPRSETLPENAENTTAPESVDDVAQATSERKGYYTNKLGVFGILMLIGTLSWAIPSANFGTLSQALFADMDPANKVRLAAITATVSSIAGAIAVIIGGLASDRTRSRFGRRKPWLLIGALVSALSMTAMPLV
ncbi:MAG: MFS transporter, partial [Propionibacteriaceae bacterium]|nr:MFS transporter [Propionibacteriaceae bacterium]